MSELTPYLCVVDSRAAAEWYADVLGAVASAAGEDELSAAAYAKVAETNRNWQGPPT